MEETEQPQFYLVTPSDLDPYSFSEDLGPVLDAVEIACIRVASASNDADDVARACDAVRLVAHERDIPVVVTDHVGLIEKLGLDGVHLTDGARAVRKLRQDLGADPIIGAYCAASRHDGMNAGEAGADYVAFGPVLDTGLGHTAPVDHGVFQWWSEMIEVPVVAEGGFNLETARLLAPVTDFISLGSEIWKAEDPVAEMKAYAAAIAG